MTVSVIHRLKAIQDAVHSKGQQEKIKVQYERYRQHLVSLKDVHAQLAGLRQRTTEFVVEGVEIQSPSLLGLAGELESQQELTLNIADFDSGPFFRGWNSVTTKWKLSLERALEELEQQFVGADLPDAVLTTLRPHFSDLVDEIRDRERQRRELLRKRPNGYLGKLKEFHQADLEALGQLAGKDAGEDWKAALQDLVSATGVNWSLLQDGPLVQWLEEHGLLDHCIVRLR